MSGARLRSTAPPLGLAPVGPCRTVRFGSAGMTGGVAPLLIPSQEHRQQAERGRQQGSSPVRAGTLGPGSVATRARPGGVALELTEEQARLLQRLLGRHLKAARSSLAFWKRELAFGHQPAFDLDTRQIEADFIQALYMSLFDFNKTKTQTNAYKTAKTAE